MDDNELIESIVSKAIQDLPESGMSVIRCPKCEDRLLTILVTEKDTTSGACADKKCLSWTKVSNCDE